MLDNELLRIIVPIIKNGFLSLGYNNISVKQSYQPTQQGANSGPTVYLSKISDHRYGFLDSKDVWDDDTQLMRHRDIQQYETVFQVNGFIISNPTDTTALTASDLVNLTAEILQNDSTVDLLEQSSVGVYRITDIRNPYFSDDKDRYEASPSFDFTLTHKQIRDTINPIISEETAGIFRI